MFGMLYAIYLSSLKNGALFLDGSRVLTDNRVLDDKYKYEEGFWHLTTKEDRPSRDRLFDPRRAERLPWCGPLIMNAGDPNVTRWEYVEGGNGKVRTYLWLEKYDYLVILEPIRRKTKNLYILITGYHVSGDSTRRRLKGKWENRIKILPEKQSPPPEGDGERSPSTHGG